MDKFTRQYAGRIVGGLVLGYAALNCLFKAGQQKGKVDMAEYMDEKLEPETRKEVINQLKT